MNLNRTVIAVVIGSAFLLLASSCSERETSTLKQVDVVQADRSQTSPAQQEGSPSSTQENVRILPSEPKTDDHLRVIVSGLKGKLTYRWDVNGSMMEGFGSSLPNTAFKKGDHVNVAVLANGESFYAEAMIHNTPPEIVSLSVSPGNFYRGIDIEVIARGSDTDKDEISYSYSWLINGEEQLFESEAILPGDSFRKGDQIVAVVTPYDGEERGLSYRTGELVAANAPPYFVSTPPEIIDSTGYRYQLQAVDPDDDMLRYRLEDAPVGMSVDETTGLITWEITPAHAGENIIRIVVSDPDGAETAQEFTMNLAYAE